MLCDAESDQVKHIHQWFPQKCRTHRSKALHMKSETEVKAPSNHESFLNISWLARRWTHCPSLLLLHVHGLEVSQGMTLCESFYEIFPERDCVSQRTSSGNGFGTSWKGQDRAPWGLRQLEPFFSWLCPDAKNKKDRNEDAGITFPVFCLGSSDIYNPIRTWLLTTNYFFPYSLLKTMLSLFPYSGY